MPGCVAGCCHRLPDTQGQQENVSTITGERYAVLATTSHCARDDERAVFRAQVYQDADIAANKAADRCKTLRGKLRARKREWDRITKPWVQGPCPFSESG